MEKLNWGIIGLGRMAEKFSEAFLDTKNAKLLAVSSKDKFKLNKFKHLYNLENKFLFENYEDLINCSEVDIVYIALPNSLHHYWVIKSIENTKNTLVEKPATLKLSEIKDINNNLINKDIFFGEAFMYRYLPQIDKVINILRNHEIGNILSMKSCFGMNIMTKKNFFFLKKKKRIDPEDRKFNKQLGGGSIYDLGCYPSSFSLMISSIIDENKFSNFKIINISKEIGETGIDINSSAELVFENGFNSKIYSSFKKNLGNISIINGDRGTVILNDTWKGNNLIIKLSNKNDKLINFDQNKNIYSYQIETISKNLINGIKKISYPGMSIKETILNTKIMESWLNE